MMTDPFLKIMFHTGSFAQISFHIYLIILGVKRSKKLEVSLFQEFGVLFFSQSEMNS